MYYLSTISHEYFNPHGFMCYSCVVGPVSGLGVAALMDVVRLRYGGRRLNLWTSVLYQDTRIDVFEEPDACSIIFFSLKMWLLTPFFPINGCQWHVFPGCQAPIFHRENCFHVAAFTFKFANEEKKRRASFLQNTFVFQMRDEGGGGRRKKNHANDEHFIQDTRRQGKNHAHLCTRIPI